MLIHSSINIFSFFKLININSELLIDIYIFFFKHGFYVNYNPGQNVLTKKNYFQTGSFVKRNHFPQFGVASYKR